MKRKPLPTNPADRVPHRAAQIREANERGLNPTQIAQELGISRARVMVVASWHGISLHTVKGPVARIDHARAVAGIAASLSRVADAVRVAPLDYSKVSARQAADYHREVVRALTAMNAFRDALKDRKNTP